ncbi:hypothetical protein BDV11DRAFT_124176 [Aspergillus similis]
MKGQQEVSSLLSSSLFLQAASHLFSCSPSQSQSQSPFQCRPSPSEKDEREKKKKTSQKLTAGGTVPVWSRIANQTTLAQRRVQNAGIGDPSGSRNVPTAGV